MTATRTVTRDDARIAVSELLGKVFAETSQVSHDEFERIVELSRSQDWPLRPGRGPDWTLGSQVRELLDQFNFSKTA